MIPIPEPQGERLSKRGQVAAEFLMYTAVFLVIVIAAYTVISYVQSSELPAKQNSVAKETGEGFENVIRLSVQGGQGFSYVYTYPRSILGAPYSLNFNSLLSRANQSFFIIWPGPYGEFTWGYRVPAYTYRVEGTCLSGSVLASDNVDCSNILLLKNDGENLSLRVLSVGEDVSDVLSEVFR